MPSPVITFCCANTAPEPWLAALHAALPHARVSVWRPGAPAADMAVVWQPPQMTAPGVGAGLLGDTSGQRI